MGGWDYTNLHSCCLVPDESPLVRNARFGIVFDPTLMTAWREVGEDWKAVNYRFISARLKVLLLAIQDYN